MNRVALALAAGLALLIVGCGGGGGTSGPTYATTQIEAAFSGGGPVIDPTNLEVSDQVQFILVGYTDAGTRTPLSASGWSTNDAGGTSGSLDGSTGAYTATNSGTAHTISVTYGGSTYTHAYQVLPIQARIYGQVLDDSTNAGVAGVTVDFYNGATLVGSCKSQYDGSFRASVPTATASFNLDASTINTARYYTQFTYGTLSYAPLVSGCNALLPSGLATGVTTTLPHSVMLPNKIDPPPPPPTGCGG